MYRKEYTETIFRTGSHTSRKSSVKQHEMAALREMEQMILAAEAVPAGAEALERATAHLEQFLQQVRQKRILDEKQRAMEAFRQQFENGYTWRNGFLRNVARFGDPGSPDRTGERNRLDVHTAECRGKPVFARPAPCRTAKGRCCHGTAAQLSGIRVRLSGLP